MTYHTSNLIVFVSLQYVDLRLLLNIIWCLVTHPYATLSPRLEESWLRSAEAEAGTSAVLPVVEPPHGPSASVRN